ncbi:MAG: hypothetical protein OEY28_14010, partial [Nitrospira sp.]|nr:hypothetical protein [Nitrospira sp.]
AFSRVDLLTTVLHEIGHVLGYGDQTITNPAQGTLMTETLSAGLRRLPSLGVGEPALSVVEGSSVNRLSGWSGSFGLSRANALNVSALSTQHSDLSPRPSVLSPQSSALGSMLSHVSPFTSHENLVGQLLRGARESFAGLWGATGTGQGPSVRPDVAVPRIDWGDDEESRPLHPPAPLATTPAKPSWLSRFLFHTGRDVAKPHDHGIEVVLPGKKK